MEGSELRVLQGGLALLRKFRPMIVFENARHLRDPSQTLAPMRYLRDLGYLFFQLGWLRQCDGGPFVLGDDLELDGQAQEILSLTPLRLEERYLRPPAINLLACHETRIPELEAQLSPAAEAGGQAQ